MQKLTNPQPYFYDVRGALADGGYIYVGVVDDDPETSPIPLFWDSDLSIPASQPLRTIGGLIVNGVTPADVFFAADDYSMRMLDNDGTLVFYTPSAFTLTSGFQPINANLSAIAALATTNYGRSLLTLANQGALQTAVGYAPFSGGTVTTNIVRQGAGTHLYWVATGLTSGRVFQIESGDPDPSGQPGDWVLELAP